MINMRLSRCFRLPVALLATLAWAQRLETFSATDDFLGPFPSWANVRAYGAIGDGRADDTAALQRALDDAGVKGRPDVVYLPAGAYRITRTLRWTGKIHVGFLGEHPARTVLRWDGPRGGTMMLANGVSLSRWGRITWDGAGRAGIGIAHQWDRKGGYAPTNLEHADEVFQDLARGIVGGRTGGWNDSEVSIHRVRFLRCREAGVSVESFNALDYWIWDSEFIDNARGVTNEFGAGNFSIYRSVFRNSRVADVTIHQTQFFSFRGNTSIGSRQFLRAQNIGRNAAHITIQDNRILDTADPVAIQVENLGPVLLIDNQIRSRSRTGPAVRLSTWAQGGDLVSIGNTYTVPRAIEVKSPDARWWSTRDRVAPRGEIGSRVPALPPPADRLAGRVFEVQPGSGAPAIQRAIDAAARVRGAIVHLAKGDYPVAQTIVVPAATDVRITGDGYGTNLRWVGPPGGDVLRVEGPGKAALRELAIDGAKRANGIAIVNADQPGACIRGDGLYQEYSTGRNLLAQNLWHARIALRGYQSLNVAGAGMEVARARVAVVGGHANCSAPDGVAYRAGDGAELMVLDSWYEGAGRKVFEIAGASTFVLQGARVAPYNAAGAASLELNGFRGLAAILNADIDGQVRIENETAAARALFLAVRGSEDRYLPASRGRIAFRNSRQGSSQAPDRGVLAPEFAIRMLAPLRAMSAPSAAPGAADIRLHRLATAWTRIGLRITR